MEMIVREIKITYKTKRKVQHSFDCPENVWKFFKNKLGNETQEVMICLCLNNKNHECGWREVSRGTISETLVHPREIFVGAIKMLSSSIILVHNHPSGVLTPSKEDIETTRRIYKAGKIVGIELLDHVIVTHDSFLSLKEGGYY